MRFSPNIRQGSRVQRSELVDNLNDKIFNRLLNVYGKKKDLLIRKIEQYYNMALPEQKSVKIFPIYENSKEKNDGWTFFQWYKGNI